MMRFLKWVVLYFKGGEIKMAMFFAQRVILGKTQFNEVPSTLQPGVKEILVESGLDFLAE